MKAIGARFVFVLLFATYVLAGIWTADRSTPTGDEPYYFLAADSLRRGEGFELSARWYWLPTTDYAPGDFLPSEDFDRSVAPSLVRRGRFPLHDLGLSILIAPAFALGGRAGVNLLVAAAMAGAIALAFVVTARIMPSRRAALAATLALGLAAPALTYSGQVFPDAIAPLAVAVSLVAVAGALPMWTGGLAVAALPFLQLRFWPLALGLLALAMVVRRPRRRELLLLLAPTVIVIVALSALDLAVYGVPLPHAGYVLFFTARHDTSVATYAAVDRWGAVGMFVDRAFGLLPAAPIAVLAFFGAGAALRQALTRWLLAAIVPYLIFVSFFDWTGGYSPQARYLAPVIPAFVPLVALALTWPVARLAAVPLFLLTFAQSAVYVHSPALRYDAYGQLPASDRAWELAFGFAPSAVFPLLGSGNDAGLPLVALWSAALVGLVAVGAVVRHAGVTRRVQSLSP